MSPLEQEGYVIVDWQFRRIKVKHPGYVALHHLRTSPVTPRKILEIVRGGEAEELTVHFPEWKGMFDEVRASYDGLVAHLEQHYNDIKDIGDRKAYAAAAKECPYFPTMFHLRDKTFGSVKESLRNIQLDNLAHVLGIKDVGVTLPPIIEETV
jgi:hypothetical protein